MPVKETVRAIWWTLLVFALSGGTLAAQQHPSQSPAKVTRLKLEQFGWQPPLPPKPGEIDSLASQTITVDTQGRVLVGFTTRGSGEGLVVKRAQLGLLFHIVRLTGSEKADLTLQLATNNWLGNGVYVDDHDRIIARANDTLQMSLGIGGESDKSSWKVLAPCGAHCAIVQSVSRRTLHLYTWDANPPVAILSMNDPSNVTHCWEPGGFAADSITDHFAYFNYDPGIPPLPPPILYRWPLCDYEQRTALPITDGRVVRVLPITDSSFLLEDWARELLYRTDGKKKQSCSLRTLLKKHETGSLPGSAYVDWGAAVDGSGRRVAILADTERGGSLLFDITSRLTGQRIIPYDMETCEPLASIPISPVSHFLRIAMGPDGHRVAALVNDTVTIADLP
jgi:hypothetical protein